MNPGNGVVSLPEFGVINSTVTGQAVIATIDTQGYARAVAHFAVGVAALTAFVVKARARKGGVQVTLASIGDDYTSPTGPIVGASAALNTAATGTHFLALDVSLYDEVTLEAAGTASTVVGEYGVS